MIRKLILLLCISPSLLISSEPSYTTSQQTPYGTFSVELDLSSSTTSLLDSIELTVFLDYPKTYHVDLNNMKINLLQHSGLLPPFTLTSDHVYHDPSSSEETARTTITYTLEPQLSGQHYLTLQTIPFLPNPPLQTETIELISDIFPIEVTPPQALPSTEILPAPLLPLSTMMPIEISPKNRQLLIDNPEKSFKEIARTQAIISSRTIPLKTLLIIALCLLAIMLGKEYLEEQKQKKEALQQPKKQNPQVKALNSLNSLLDQKFLEKNQFSQFYEELSDLLRFYLRDRYGLHAPEESTEEFLHHLKKDSHFSNKRVKALAQFLYCADVVKFSRYVPSHQECHQAESFVKHIISSD